MNEDKPVKVYFASDVHLGVPNKAASREREKCFVRWLDMIQKDATALYLVGDLFDFWFEYKKVVPKGYVRVLGKLAELRDRGLPVYFFTGNHDLWMFGYFEEELNIPVFHKSKILEINRKKFFVGHGDGLGPGDTGYKLLKKYLFTNRFCQWLLALLHPNIGMGLANFFSGRSRHFNSDKDDVFLGEDRERLIVYARKKLMEEHFDFFVFGHRHYPLEMMLNENSKFINLGDWIKHFSYAVYDSETKELKLQYFENKKHF